MVADIYKGLNSAQLDAVKNYEGATLIIAGAGSGKTRTLTCRIANMIESGVKPWQIMALTFTNKAARDMRERIISTLPAERLRGLRVGTFHSVFRRILMQYSHSLGFSNDYTIYDSADSQNLIKQIIKELELAEDKYKPRLVASRISLAKNNLVLPSVYATTDAILEADNEIRCPRIYQVYERYVARCKQNGAMDFDDILLYMNILLRDNKEAAEQISNQFKYLLIDEYQDTNVSQYMILRRLATSGNICVVGDDSQSIYSFRGAKIENILRFSKDYPNARTIKLEENYRSTRTIVDAANSLINHNTRRLPKTLFSSKEVGDKIYVNCCYNDRDEANRIVSSISHRLREEENCTAKDFAILYRTNSQSRVFEDSLRHKSIPYKIYGGQSFYTRAEIKDVVSYLKLIVNSDDDIAFKRIINTPTRGIGSTSVDKIEALARSKNVSMFSIIRNNDASAIGVRSGAGLQKFLDIYNDLDNMLQNFNTYEIATTIIGRSGLTFSLQRSTLPEDKSRLDNIEELLNSIKEFMDLEHEPMIDDNGESLELFEEGSISHWLSEVSLLTDQDNNAEDIPQVTLLTVHASKGLEFKHIFIVGLEENLFPSSRATDSLEEIEEERRIFYVALTRAEKSVTLSFAQSRFKYGDIIDCSPSRFLKEIDTAYLTGDVEDISPRRISFPDDDISSPSFEGSLSDKPSSVGRRVFSSTATRVGSSSRRSTTVSNNNVQSPLDMIAERLSQIQSSAPRDSTRGSFSSQKRLIKRSINTDTILNSSASTPLNSVGDINVGANVEHGRFGKGVITSLEKTIDDVRITVRFNGIGEKTLLQRFAKLKLL